MESLGYKGVSIDLSNMNLALSDESTNGNTSSSHLCSDWPQSSFGLYQVANVFHLAAFIVPHNFQASPLVMRGSILIGQITFFLWTYLNVCGRDILSWTLALMAVNFCHIIYLVVKNWPPTIPGHLKDLYAKLFEPLKVSLSYFRLLTKEAEVKWLDRGEIFAEEDKTFADQRLSILITGKVRVTCDGAHIHDILPHQFLDSPEWEASENCNPNNFFQVSLTAVERSRYITWSRPVLKEILLNKPFLHSVITCLIGKDITTKLYSLTEERTHINGKKDALLKVSKMNLIQNQSSMHRSRSVDTVHTGSSGYVRSDGWIPHTRDIDSKTIKPMKKISILKCNLESPLEEETLNKSEEI